MRTNINMKILNLKNGKENKIKLFSTEDLNKFISSITSVDLDKKKYFIEETQEVKKFMEETYNKGFFGIKDSYIYLQKLPNGIRRTKEYKRKRNDDITFKKTFGKIKKNLEKNPFFLVETELVFDNNDLILIKIFFKNYMSEESKVKIIFNKKTWKYKFISLDSEIYFDYLFHLLKKTFEKYTSSTRNYRKKHDYRFK